MTLFANYHQTRIYSGFTFLQQITILYLLFLFFALLAMIFVGFPSLWILVKSLRGKSIIRTIILMVEGLIAGTIFIGVTITPRIIDREDILTGGSLGMIAALSASVLFNLFSKEPFRG